MIGNRICLDEVKDKVLYHYKKSNGINGIMNNKCFWATKNDLTSADNTQGCQLFCADRKSEGKICY